MEQGTVTKKGSHLNKMKGDFNKVGRDLHGNNVFDKTREVSLPKDLERHRS